MSSFPRLLLPKVLLIDDSPDDQFKVRWMLSRERRVELYEASTALEGAKLWKRVCPDLVLLDLNLPDQMGDQVMRQAKAEGWGDPIIIALSGMSLVDRVSDLSAAGITGFVPKDRFTQELLSGLMTQVVERLSSRHRLAQDQSKLDRAIDELVGRLRAVSDGIGSLATPATRSDSPGVRLLRGVLVQRQSALMKTAGMLEKYREIQGFAAGSSCTIPVFEEVLKGLSPQPVSLLSDVADDMELAVDAESLAQVMLPLLDNAFRHDLGEPVAAQIEVTLVGNRCRLLVRNLSPSLSMALQSTPHELFRLGASDPDSGTSGLGLGLAGVLKRISSSSIALATVVEPGQGFGILVEVPVRS